jgi:hypothetical protein
MRKIDSLRATLTAAFEELAADPSRLRVWIDRGTAQSRQTATFGFAMAFRLNVLLMAMSTDLASVGYVLCAWLRTHQPDLLRPGQDAWSFDLDPLDNGTYDALIQLDLTQSISVAPDAQGTPRLTYLPEPEPLFADALPFAGLPEAPLLKAIAVVGEGQIAPSIPPMPDDDLTRLDEWLGQILQGLSAPERRSAALKLGQALRRSNLKRIAANVDPDGTPFAPRKPRYDRQGRLRARAGGKMFQGLRYAKHWRIDADETGVELSPPPRSPPAWPPSASSAKPSP